MPNKLFVTLVKDGTNSYSEGIELEMRWVFHYEETISSKVQEVIMIVNMLVEGEVRGRFVFEVQVVWF